MGIVWWIFVKSGWSVGATLTFLSKIGKLFQNIRPLIVKYLSVRIIIIICIPDGSPGQNRTGVRGKIWEVNGRLPTF